MAGMEDVVETKLGKSLEDLIKEQKKVQTKKPKAKKKPATPQAVNKAGKAKAGKGAQEAKKPANQKTQQAPATKSLKQAALKTTKGGGIQKKGQAGNAKVMTIPASAARMKKGAGVVIQKGRPSAGRTVIVQKPKARPTGKQQQQQRPAQKGGNNPRPQQGPPQQRGQPSHPQQQRQQAPPQQQYQQQQQQHQPYRQDFGNTPPPGFLAPRAAAAPAALPGKIRNPYSDALYAKSHKPLHARFEELHRVRADQNVVEATVRGVQQFSSGPRNKHGVLLPA